MNAKPESAEGAVLCAMIDDDLGEVERRLSTFTRRELIELIDACNKLRQVSIEVLRRHSQYML